MSLALWSIEIDLMVEAYVNKVLERFQMKDYSPSVAPILKSDKFNMNQCLKNNLERESIKNIPSALVVGSLMQLEC